MSKKVDMNVFLHFLLVIKQMNNFTVSEAKDALLHECTEFTDAVETRKFVYRQLTRNVKKGLLKRVDIVDNKNKKVFYSKTELFFESTLSPITRRAKTNKRTTETMPSNLAKKLGYQKELEKELHAYEIDLSTILEEAKEYKRLSERFPNLQEQLQKHHSIAKEKSIKLLGRIHALQNLLDYKPTGHQIC